MRSESTNITAILLAAGMSRRMGSPKALLDLGGRPLIVRMLDSVRAVPQIGRIIVVTGHEPQSIQKAAGGDRTSFTHNARYQTGEMLSSIQAGIGAIQPPCDAFFIMLLDQPLVRAATMAAQIEAWRSARPMLVIPTHHEKRGHPLLLDSRAIPQILAIPENGSLRDFVVHQSASDICRISADDDPGVVTDVDTPDDYQKVLELWNRKNKTAR